MRECGTLQAKASSHQVCALRLDERVRGGLNPYRRNHPLIKSVRPDLMRGVGTVEAKQRRNHSLIKSVLSDLMRGG